MSENDTQAAAVVESPRKARRPAKKPAKKTAVKSASSNGSLGDTRLKVLRAAAKPGRLAQQIKRTGLSHRLVYHHLWCLRRDGYVKSSRIDIDGIKELTFEQTAKGKKAAAK